MSEILQAKIDQLTKDSAAQHAALLQNTAVVASAVTAINDLRATIANSVDPSVLASLDAISATLQGDTAGLQTSDAALASAVTPPVATPVEPTQPAPTELAPVEPEQLPLTAGEETPVVSDGAVPSGL